MMLCIQYIEFIDDSDCLFLFSGPRADFTAFVQDLKLEGYRYAHWDPEQLNGRGAWVVDFDTLKPYSVRFDEEFDNRVQRALDRHYQRCPLR